ncbi:Leucine-rich repeat serine/threonine-protein kinase 2 [Rhizophlyctis rosea]|uniref:Leucine-rich repeat serine/threonine-protein kinase 2 n=1 Tax=Rhizophlyctis rosea TaxID=64517 RepID=A0AAD5S9D9_9FUNG|nr:Leucine-rich repeat serine/threonine-protein kinase 2 [Rhizophlyctis rosea]
MTSFLTTPPTTPPTNRRQTSKPLGAWSVFMSYCWLNSIEAAELGQVDGSSECGPCDPRQLARDLSNGGYSTWLDVDRLGDSTPLYDELVKGILPSKCVVACISDAYIKSRNCNLEFKYVHKLQIPMILVIVGSTKCDFSRSSIGFMAGDLLYIDATSSPFSKTLDRVNRAIKTHTTADLPLETPPLDPLAALKDAAESGDRQSQYQLAITLDPTLGTEPYRSASAAAKWYEKAAKKGHTLAQYSIGLAYKHGNGVEQDEDLSIEYFHKAADKNNLDAIYELGLFYQSEDNTPTAAEYYEEAARQGHGDAQAALGYCYVEGVGLEEDVEEAVKWYRKAAEQGNVRALVAMGGFYEDGRGVERDLWKAYEWFGKAAERGSQEGNEGKRRVKGRM